jgi:hypothetical protein
MEKNGRKFERYDSLNLLSYERLDSENKTFKQGMGRTLNISEGGVLLETHEPLGGGDTLLISIGIKDEVIDVRSNVVYTNPDNKGMFKSGIEFIEVSLDALVVLRKYIEEFHKQDSV